MKAAHSGITKALVEKDKKAMEVDEQHGGYSAFYKNYLKDIKENHRDILNSPNDSSALKLILEDPKLSE
jgi:hypothetical protein